MYHCHVADHMESGMMATYTIVAPRQRSCPVKLTPGTLWQSSQPSDITVTNLTSKTVRRLGLHASYFVNTAENLNGFPYEWNVTAEIRPEDKETINLAGRFEHSALGSYYSDESVIGLAFYPGRIEYSDGTVWTPRELGECFHISWRAPKKRPEMTVLPPLQPDEEEQEDQD
jgi:hypothetical protein